MNVNAYELKFGDSFIISYKLYKKSLNNKQKQNFVIIGFRKYIKWYNPFTWFKKYVIIKYQPC